ncbi:Leucine aminopeptidase 1 [Orbilia ellipsospora]|uniref:Peptide hydrolase n=1 Tax=Orbilia ellipsospora TaxID=2528407 RepID=A0AAV9X8P6_9PEZI
MPPTEPCHPNPTFPSAAQFVDQVNNLITNITLPRLHDDLQTLVSFYTRHFRTSTGRDAAIWVQQRLRSVLNDGTNITVSLFEHQWTQPSVIARIPGTSNITIVLSAHIDSVNLYLPFFLAAPGANDDASGVVALLSAFTAISQSKVTFTNTLEFHIYAAEEAGFWGSSDVFSSYNKARRNVYSLLQFDNIGSMAKGHKPSVGIVTDYLPVSFSDYIRLLVLTYLDVPVVETVCGYACSDHAAAIRYGYTGGLVTAGRLEDFTAAEDKSHTSADTMDKVDLEHVMRFAKLGIAYAYELGFADLGGDGIRGYTCDIGYPDGWSGSVLRFGAARSTDPLGLALWALAAFVILMIARPWEEVPCLMKMGRKVKRVFKRGSRGRYTRVTERDVPD